MKIGVAIEETWDFFNELYADFSEQHETMLFKRREIHLPMFHARANRKLFNHDLSVFMRQNDVVFFEWASHLLAAASKLPKTSGIVTRLHRYEMYRWVDNIDWDKVDNVILVSKAKQREFVERFPAHSGKIVVVPEAISLAKFPFQRKPFEGNIGTLCHLTPRKRVYDLLLAFYDLNRQSDGFHLHIAGGPNPAFQEYHIALLDAVKALGLQNKVTFYGNITDSWNWYKKIDIFISNSYSEGLQVAPMEAMASGCYCLSHWWGGADELLPEESLFYSNSQLHHKLLEYADLSEEEKRKRQECMRSIVADNFDIDQIKVRIRSIVEMAGMRNAQARTVGQ